MGRISHAAVLAVIVGLAVLSGHAATQAARDAVTAEMATSSLSPTSPGSPESDTGTDTAASYGSDALVLGSARSNAHGWRPGPAALQVGDDLTLRPELVDAFTLAQLLAPTSCNLPVSLLAAIGQVEVGDLEGRRIDLRNRVVPPVLGPVLNRDAAGGPVPDSDRGELDGHRRWDRALGPMQLLPATWREVGFDADGDGARDPQNVYDAAGAAMAFLCQEGRDLATAEGVRGAVLAYHDSPAYLRLVLAWKAAYDARGLVQIAYEPPMGALVLDEPLALALRARPTFTQPARTQPVRTKPVPTKPVTTQPVPTTAVPTTPVPTKPSPTAVAPTTPVATTTTTAAAEAPTGTPTGTPTETPTPCATPTASTPTSTPTQTPSEAATATPTVTPTVTPTATATPTPSESATPVDASAVPTPCAGQQDDQGSSEERRNE